MKLSLRREKWLAASGRFNKYISPFIVEPRLKRPYPNRRMNERQKTLRELRHSLCYAILDH